MAIAGACEVRLLRCSLGQPVPLMIPVSIESSIQGSLQRAVELIEQGLYSDVVAMEVLREMFGEPSELFSEGSDPAMVAKSAHDLISVNVHHFLHEHNGDPAAGTLVLAAGVAILFVFLQTNFTGPRVDFPVSPTNVVWKLEVWNAASERAWDSWARSELMVDGCDLQGKCAYPQYLVLAKLLFETIKCRSDVPTCGWWAARGFFAQQKILVERSPTLLKEITGGYAEAVETFGIKFTSEENGMASAAVVEAALVEYYYGHSDEARVYLEQAEKITGLKYTVEGAMGYRRQHQMDPKAQMVLKDESDLEVLEKEAEAPASSDGGDVLREPRLEDSAVMFLHQKVLSPTQQAIILVHCLDVKKKSSADELRSWEMAPFIEAVGAQQESPFMIRNWCELLRVEWEKARGPTRERAFLLMERIVADIREGTVDVAQRMHSLFCVQFPCIQALLKQYANMLVGFGCVGEALMFFEELELWQDLIDCHRMLGDTARAVSLIKENLEISPRDPRLWCSLGHATNDDTCFSKSWEVSGGRFAAAQRALARFAFNKKEYAEAVKHWDLALGLNPLYSEGWFAAGFAALKDGQMDKALNSFVRTVQLDPDNGEAFNNIAAVNMRKKNYQEANIAFKEALKFKRNSWELWDNYAQVQFEIGSYSQAVVALSKVLELSPKNVNLGSLKQLVEQAEKLKQDAASCEGKETEKLVQSLGDLVSKMASSGSYGGEIWGLKARWHKLMADPEAASAALLRQIRAFQGSDWQRDAAKFHRFAESSLQLCRQYLEIGGKRELAAAERHLMNTLKQGEEFSGTEEYKSLEAMSSEVQRKQG